MLVPTLHTEGYAFVRVYANININPIRNAVLPMHTSKFSHNIVNAQLLFLLHIQSTTIPNTSPLYFPVLEIASKLPLPKGRADTACKHSGPENIYDFLVCM